MSLRRAAFTACLFAASRLHAQQVAITFDDLPVHSALPPGVTREQVAVDILAALKAAGAPPIYGFVNANHLERNPALGGVLDLWRKAGNPLGSHTWSHMNLNEHTVTEWEADVLKDEPAIASRMKNPMQEKDWHWLRFPYLAEGDTPQKADAVRAFLAEHHYRIAGVTMSFHDYAFNEPYARCKAKNDDAGVATLEAAYLQAAKNTLYERRAMMQAAFGHEIPLVLLMHIGALDARMMPRLLAMYKDEGVKLVTLEQAESDPFYKNDLDPTLPHLPDTLEGLLAAKKLAIPHAAPEEDVSRLCR